MISSKCNSSYFICLKRHSENVIYIEVFDSVSKIKEPGGTVIVTLQFVTNTFFRLNKFLVNNDI